jgi:hypothetical protein
VWFRQLTRGGDDDRKPMVRISSSAADLSIGLRRGTGRGRAVILALVEHLRLPSTRTDRLRGSRNPVIASDSSELL